MANLNRVMLIGRLTRDPEVRVFANGGKVANFGFAVNNRRKNAATGQWEDEPVFIDVKAFNRERGRPLADLIEQYMRKGQQFYVEGKLTLDQWTTQDGQKVSKLRVILDDFQFLEPRSEGRPSAPTRAPVSSGYHDAGHDEQSSFEPSDSLGQEEDIPF